MKRREFHIAAVAGLSLAAIPAAAQKSKTSDTSLSFATPELALEHIVAALRDGDMSRALLAFDVEQRASNYSFVKHAESLRIISFDAMVLPVRFDFYQETARIKFTAEVALQLRNLVFSLLAPTDQPLNRPIVFDQGEDVGKVAAELEATLDPARLANLKVQSVKVPDIDIVNSEAYQRNIAAQLSYTGGNDMQDRYYLLELDGKTYVSGISFVHYGDGWKVRTMMSTLGGTDPSGAAMPASQADFDSLP